MHSTVSDRANRLAAEAAHPAPDVTLAREGRPSWWAQRDSVLYRTRRNCSIRHVSSLLDIDLTRLESFWRLRPALLHACAEAAAVMLDKFHLPPAPPTRG